MSMFIVKYFLYHYMIIVLLQSKYVILIVYMFYNFRSQKFKSTESLGVSKLWFPLVIHQSVPSRFPWPLLIWSIAKTGLTCYSQHSYHLTSVHCIVSNYLTRLNVAKNVFVGHSCLFVMFFVTYCNYLIEEIEHRMLILYLRVGLH